MVLGDELIQFASAVPLSAGLYRLSRLLRGRRGIEWAADSHAIGDTAPLPVAVRFVAGESLRPPSPCHLRLWRDCTSLHAEWVRRSHRGWAWIDGVGVADDPFPEFYRLTVTGPAGQADVESTATNASLVVSELPAISGDSISVSVAMAGPMALSRAVSATVIL